MRSVLILGGTGRTSLKLTKLCVSEGDDVTISVRGKHKISNDISSVKRIILDRNNKSAVKSELNGKFYDVVFDCSGYLPQCVDWVLSSIITDRYIYISSFEVYAHYHNGINLSEENLPISNKTFENSIKIGDRGWYARGKYSSELLIANKYHELNYAIVRIPFVMSLEDNDYEDKASSRVLKYVSPVVNGIPINDKNIDRRYSFTENSDEASFLCFLSKTDFKGIVNFASQGFVTMRDILRYTEEKLGKKAVLDDNAENLPFTIHPEVTMNLSRCMSIGYIPLKLDEWLWKKVDKYIDYSIKLRNFESLPSEINRIVSDNESFQRATSFEIKKIPFYTGLHFTNQNNYFYEKIIDGKIFLYVKPGFAKRGVYAIAPLNFPLIKGRRYKIDTEFLINSKSSVFNIHIYNSKINSFQVILSHKTQPSDEPVYTSKTFIPRDENFDSIMVGAGHLLGDGAYVSFNHLLITEIAV